MKKFLVPKNVKSNHLGQEKELVEQYDRIGTDIRFIKKTNGYV